MEGDSPQWALVPVETHTFESAAIRPNQVMLWCGLKLAFGYIISCVFWEAFLCKPISALPMISLLVGATYKAICDWLLPMLDLKLCKGGLIVNKA